MIRLASLARPDAAAVPDEEGEAGGECVYPVCFINGTLELPAPHVVINLTGEPLPSPMPPRGCGAAA